MLMVVKSVFSLKAICLLGNCFFGCRIALAQACNEHAGRRGKAITCGTIQTWLASPVHGGMQLGVEPSLGAAHRLLLLASGGVGTVAVNLDVSGVDHAEVLACTPLHLLHGLIPEPRLGPAAEVAIDGLPCNVGNIQRTPAAAFLEHEEDPCDDPLQTAQRTTCTCGDRLPLLVFRNLWLL